MSVVLDANWQHERTSAPALAHIWKVSEEKKPVVVDLHESITDYVDTVGGNFHVTDSPVETEVFALFWLRVDSDGWLTCLDDRDDLTTAEATLIVRSGMQVMCDCADREDHDDWCSAYNLEHIHLRYETANGVVRTGYHTGETDFMVRFLANALDTIGVSVPRQTISPLRYR